MIRRTLLALLLAGVLAPGAFASSCPPPFLLAWESPGGPRGLAADPSGSVYLVESGWRIRVFDPNGVFLRTWGTFGTGDGQFTEPQDVAIDAQGYVYVTDSGRQRVQKFTSTGTFVTKWGGPLGGSGDGQFSGCVGIAADAAGDIYVVDSGNCRVQKFASDGTFLLKWGSCGNDDGQFGTARGIAVDQQGVVYVSDGSRVQKFTSTGSFLGVLGTPGVTFTGTYAVDVDASGRIYAACNGDLAIHVATSDGTPICTWGSAGSGDGQFNFLYGVSVGPSGVVYVSDAGNTRVEKFGDVTTATLRSSWGRLKTIYR